MHVLLQSHCMKNLHLFVDSVCVFKTSVFIPYHPQLLIVTSLSGKKKCKLFQHIPYNTNQQPISSVLTGFSSLSMFFSLWPGGLEARHQIAKENSKEGKCG